MMAAAIGTIFAQPTGAEVTDQVDKVAAMLQPKFPAVATMLLDAREDLTAFAGFPPAHWTKIVKPHGHGVHSVRVRQGQLLETPAGWLLRTCAHALRPPPAKALVTRRPVIRCILMLLGQFAFNRTP
jgi:hypothetical protein